MDNVTIVAQFFDSRGCIWTYEEGQHRARVCVWSVGRKTRRSEKETWNRLPMAAAGKDSGREWLEEQFLAAWVAYGVR